MENMRKIVVHYHTGYCGSDGIDFYEVPEDTTDDQLYELAYEGAVEHAAQYGYYPPPEFEDEESELDEDDSISENIEGWFEDYDPDEHDSKVPGGGKPKFMKI
jgi:hypothetical protein